MSNFQHYIATEQRTYPSFDLTAVPGFVYDFGTIPVPFDGRWATSAGPATGVFDNTIDVVLGNVIGLSGGYVYTTLGPPNIGNFAPPMFAYDLAGSLYGCVGSGNPGAWVMLVSGSGATEDEITRADAAYAQISHLTASDPHGDRSYSDTQLALLAADPLGMGPLCILGALSSQTWGAANDCLFTRLLGGGTISKVAFNCGTPSGNAQVAVWRGSGLRRARVPATRLAASGSQIIVTGYNEIPLGSSVDVLAGDFLCLAVDNATATIAAFNGSTSNIYSGLYYKQTSAFPIPSTVGTLVATGLKVPQLVGVA